MKTYKLLKDLPLAKAGTEVYMRNWVLEYTYIEDHPATRCIWYVDPDDFSEWLEEVTEKPKTVWDLKKWDMYYYVSMYSSDIQNNTWDWSLSDTNIRNIWLIFLTEQEAKNALIRMKTANREDKFVPKVWDWYYRPYDENNYDWYSYGNRLHEVCIVQAWLAFPSYEECEAYMTDEVKRAFWYIS